ncbi:MAG: hypothetical protein ABJA67_05790 [Chthonomonadales bacterium]
MRSVRTREFRSKFESLPENIREKALQSFRLWMANTSHPGLYFKQIDSKEDIWSARINVDFRAVCMKKMQACETVYIWFWIGPHDEYERLIG